MQNRLNLPHPPPPPIGTRSRTSSTFAAPPSPACQKRSDSTDETVVVARFATPLPAISGTTAAGFMCECHLVSLVKVMNNIVAK